MQQVVALYAIPTKKLTLPCVRNQYRSESLKVEKGAATVNEIPELNILYTDGSPEVMGIEVQNQGLA